MGYLAITLIGIFCLMYLAFCEGKETNKQSEWHFTNLKKPIIGKYIENQDGHIALYLGDDLAPGQFRRRARGLLRPVCRRGKDLVHPEPCQPPRDRLCLPSSDRGQFVGVVGRLAVADVVEKHSSVLSFYKSALPFGGRFEILPYLLRVRSFFQDPDHGVEIRFRNAEALTRISFSRR